jgi:hypothetical protein
LKTPFLEKLGFFTRIPEQLSLYFYDFPLILYRFYKTQTFNPISEDVILQQAPPSKTEITIRSPAAEQGWPAARDGRTPASERLGWGLNSPSVTWWGWFGRKRLWRWSAAREAAVCRGGRKAGEQASQPANARAREGPRGAGGDYCDA